MEGTSFCCCDSINHLTYCRKNDRWYDLTESALYKKPSHLLPKFPPSFTYRIFSLLLLNQEIQLYSVSQSNQGDKMRTSCGISKLSQCLLFSFEHWGLLARWEKPRLRCICLYCSRSVRFGLFRCFYTLFSTRPVLEARAAITQYCKLNVLNNKNVLSKSSRG